MSSSPVNTSSVAFSSSFVSFSTPSRPLSIDTSNNNKPSSIHSTSSSIKRETESGPSSSRSSSELDDSDLFGSPNLGRGGKGAESSSSSYLSPASDSDLPLWETPGKDSDIFLVTPGTPGPLEIAFERRPVSPDSYSSRSPSPTERISARMTNANGSNGVNGEGGGESVPVPEVAVGGVPPRLGLEKRDKTYSLVNDTGSPLPSKQFDPFAPLPPPLPSPLPVSYSSGISPAAPTISISPRLSNGSLHSSGSPDHAPVAAPTSSSSSSFATSQSISRDTRPASLFIPMDDGLSVGRTGNTPTWPFNERRGSSAEELLFADKTPSPLPLPLKSPSMINPQYGIQPPSPTGSSPAIPIPRRPSPKLEAEDFIASSSSYTPVVAPRSTPALGIFSTGTPGARRISVPPGTGAGEKESRQYDSSRHASTYSMGTHSLLSSRAALSTRVASAMDTPTSWLLMYFAFNLGLTLFNKLVLQGFPFPWTLTGIQMLSGTVGTQIALNRGFFVQANLTMQESAVMLAFSTLYTINIAVSNLSLHLVTVPFHQVVRAMTPLFTIVISAMFFRKRYSRNTYLALLPVVAGVVFATYGDYYFTTWGLILTLIGTALAAIKTLVTNRVQVGRLKLHPLDLLIRMSPLAFMQCVLWGWYSGELEKVRIYGATQMTRTKAIALAVNGVIAFGLNVVSFTANKKTSALTMTVAANVKQVLTIILAVLIFNLTLNGTNIFGILLTLIGGAIYGWIELNEKSKVSPPSSAIPAEEKRLIA